MKAPALSSKKFRLLLEKNKVFFVRVGKGDHFIFARRVGDRTFAAPVQMGKQELSPDYVKLVLKQLGFTAEEIKDIFKGKKNANKSVLK